MVDRFFEKGWAVFPPDPRSVRWAECALKDATRALHDPRNADQYQCEGTWFVGLDVLQNDEQGRVRGSSPLAGQGVDFVAKHCGGWPALHRGQISGLFPGYPAPRVGESDAAFRYRLKRDAAHVDGILGLGEPKRRFVKEPHAFILGIPLTQADPSAAPLVVWEGSHMVMQKVFARRFENAAAGAMDEIDVTEVYQEARRHVFDTCRRKAVTGEPGSMMLVHRLALHGVAPWAPNATAAPEGRLIAYFRPQIKGGVRSWVDAP